MSFPSDCVRREALRSIANSVRTELARASPNGVHTELPRASPNCVWTELLRLVSDCVHRHPFGRGGGHSVANVSLACKCHNGYLAEVDYGREAIARHRRSGTRPLEPTPPPSP